MGRPMYPNEPLRVFICGGNFSHGPRDKCPNSLHNWPLPSGYNERSDAANARLRQGWSSVQCPDCKLYGWRPNKMGPDDVLVTPEQASRER